MAAGAAKICFMRPYAAMNRNLNRPGFLLPTVNFGARSVDSLRELHRLSGNNIGNFIHTEAMPRILDFDIARSAMIDLGGAVRLRGAERVASVLNERFDLLVFSCANLIRPGTQMKAEMSVFGRLTIPVVIVGAGIQQPPEDGLAQLEPSLVDFLRFANDSALIFGVRGDLTAEFLAGQGLGGAEPLGCPSFYAMPHGIEAVAPVTPGDGLRAISAGHIQSRQGPGGRYRKVADLLHRIPGLAGASYVFQNELFFNPQPADARPALDPASRRFEDGWVAEKFFAGGDDPGRVSFFYFADTGAWRQHCAAHDFYLGDRIHGGVIALQAGRPAVFVHNDARVRELAAKIGAPGLALESLDGISGEQVIAEYLSAGAVAAMKRTYRANAGAFLDRLQRAGLALSGDHRDYLAAAPA